MILIFSGLVGLRLYALQVLAHERYKSQADNQHKYRQEILPARGEVFVKEKSRLFPVAVNRELKTAYAVPAEIENLDHAILEVSEILSLDLEEVGFKLSKKDDLYEVLKRKLSDEEVEKIRNLEEKGIYLEGENWRYYPGEELASHVIGFIGYRNDDFKGQYGIEREYEDVLRGNTGLLEQERDTFGRWISIGAKSLIPARNGNDLVLTLDHVIQFKAELALRNAVERHGADGGKLIILDPHSGKILAMAAFPNFNLNDYSGVEDISVFMNPLVSSEYECGSVFKTITMAAGLDTGKINPETTYYDTGSVVEAGYEIKNSDEKSYGQQTMIQVIEQSLNTGAIYVQRQVGNQSFLRYVEDFGFGQNTGIHLPGEVSGNISNLHTNRNIEFFTASFGQGITVTPLQLAMAYGVIANGGELLEPQIVDYMENALGEKVVIEKAAKKSVVSKDTSNKLSLMLESNVINGHGKAAGVPGYRVAGKTGTAQIANRQTGGYLENATVGTFAGFGPVDNPVFVMVAIIDYPKDVEWAESTAGPVFGEMAKFLFEYYGIEPTEEYTQEEIEKFTRTHNYLISEEEKKRLEEIKRKEEEEEDEE